MRHLFHPLLGLLLMLTASTGLAQIKFGAIGDSLTDEYLEADSGNQFHTDIAADNWLEILASKRAADFDLGTYNAPPVLWDTSVNVNGLMYDDPRDYGHEHNWAKVGAAASRTSTMKVEFGENILNIGLQAGLFGIRSSYGDTMAAGIATQIIAGDVDTVYVGLGSNDFFYQTRQFDAAQNDYPRPEVDTNDPVWQDSIAADVSGAILQAIDTILSAGSVNIIVGELPLGTASGLGSGDDPGTLAAIAKTNVLLRAGVLSRGIPADAIVDLFAYRNDPQRVNANDEVLIEGWVIPQNSVAQTSDLLATGAGPCNSAGLCARPSHGQKFIAEDGRHPNTIIQGLMANEIIAGLNSAYGAGIAPLTDVEILDAAGMAPFPAGCL